MVLVTLVIGAVIGQSAVGDTGLEDRAEASSSLHQIQSAEGPLRGQIDQMNAEVDRLIGEESRLRQEQAAAQHELEQKQAELDQATAQLNAEKAELARVRAKLQSAVAALEQLLVDMYKANDPDVTSVVMQSASWSDLLTRAEYIDHIQEYDNEVVARVRGLRDQITALVNQLQATRDRILAARNAVAAKERQIASQHAQISQQQSQLAAARNARQGVRTRCSARSARFRRTSRRSRRRRATRPSTPMAMRSRPRTRRSPSGRDRGRQSDRRPSRSRRRTRLVHGERLRLLRRRQLHASRRRLPLQPARLDRPRGLGRLGGGNWITVFANSGHAWAYVAGLRWDTGGPGSGNGPRWSTVMRDDASSFVARHPSGY